MTWLRASSDGVLLSLHVQPGAKKTEVAGLYGETLKLRLAAPPVDGKANAALMTYLARQLGLPRSQLVLVSGLASRNKRVAIKGISAQQVTQILSPVPRAD